MSAPTIFYLAGMALLFVGERLLGEGHLGRAVLGVLAIASLAAAVGLRLKARAGASGDRRGAETTLLALAIVGVASLGLYALSMPAVVTALGAEVGGRLQGALFALWPIVWVCATLPLLLVDWAHGQMPAMTQPRRIRFAAQTGLALALALSLAFPINYLGARHIATWDLRQIRATAPGGATEALVEALEEPIDVYLFFPPANDVQRELEPYFSSLRRHSDVLRVKNVDHAVSLDLAERFRVSSNGSVVLASGDDVERINVGTTLDGARGQMQRFDELFQARLLELTRRERTVYFTVGHEEMHWRPIGDEPTLRRLSEAKRVLEQLNFRVAELGAGDGLTSGVPDDAAAVIVAGPRQPFLPEEIAVLEDYATEGGRLLVLLEPGEEHHEEIVSLFGVRYHPELINNDRHHLTRTRTKADRAIVGTNNFSSHPSVTTLERHASRLLMILDGSGWLETLPEPGLRVSTTVRSMPRSWADVIPNHELDPEVEKRGTWNLGAAAWRDTEDGPFRGAVLANANAVSDTLIRYQGNLQWFVDTIRWLTDDEDLAGLVESEADVRIRHTREQDVAWFYGTIFAVPLGVLIGGMVHIRRRRRRSTS